MAEFDDLRGKLRDARAALTASDGALFAAREQLRQIEARQAELARVFDPHGDDQARRAERERLAREQAAIRAEVERLREAHRGLKADEAVLAGNFAIFTNPRDGIARLDDRTPILLMPVRLETRFRDLTRSGGGHELWVRIYPDDCWVDTFDPALTEAEIANTRTYWINWWQAGGIEAQQRAAWRALVGSHGAGRAAWLAERYRPTNVASPPVKAKAEDLVLTIATDTPLGAVESAAAVAFWRSAWLADGATAGVTAARTALDAAVGAARAADIVTAYAPVNFEAKPATGFTRAQIAVGVAFVLFDAADGVPGAPAAWSRAPRVDLLPDRFVFLGYRGSDPPLMATGNPVPARLFVGPDPSLDAKDNLRNDGDGNLVLPDPLLWLADFPRAERDGMALRIPLDAAQARGGFDRVLVIGLRINADADAARVELESLLTHHARTRTGLSLVPQGTPTNNTEAAGAGYDRQDDADQSFDDRRTPQFTTTTSALDKRDGQWLAEYLGVDPALFTHVHHAGMTDQLASRAMNAALWPATLGYWMETMMKPVFTAAGIDFTRQFFSGHVCGAGAVPAIRIGAQPYGILPATAFSRMSWFNARHLPDHVPRDDDALLPMLPRLYAILKGVDGDWRAQIPSPALSHLGQAGDPHALLLDILGLHPGSVEWSQRYAESLSSLFNRLKLQGFGGMIEAIVLAAQRQAARDVLTARGYAGNAPASLLDIVFSGAHYELKGGVVDDKPLSETLPLRAYTPGNQNYVQWLIDAAKASLSALYVQDGFVDDKPPAALLYLLLRHALQLGYHDVSIKLHEAAGLYTPAQTAVARSEAAFLHISAATTASESRYQPLYAVAPAITGNQTQTVGAFIAERLPALTVSRHLREQLAALERLKGLPTARLERAFADHVDTCSYRLDAWLMGLVTYQLALMRDLATEGEAPARRGVHLGAYGYLEDLRPENKVMTPVDLHDDALAAIFDAPEEPPLTRDSTNQGYVHAPSLNHAVTAAILRNGYVSDATPANRQAMAVNLTSERVRVALGLLEGIRAGQGLGDLLGYRFERGLHDKHALAEVDKFIYKLRKAFPLRGDRLQSTKTAEGVSIESIEARNVIDGLALVEHMKSTGSTSYPFGKTTLPAATAGEAAAIDAEAARLLDAHDAVADLALAEGVYQAVLGNYDRVAATYDAYARGNFPPEPDVVRTPFNGIGITSRVALHLPAGADPMVSPIPGLGMTPRAQGEPAINAWLAARLPPLAQMGCVVSFREAATGTATSRQVTLRDLELQPVDLVSIIRDDASGELDDRVLRHAATHFGPRADVPVTIAYMDKTTATFSIFAAFPLMRALRRLTQTSRPLTVTDLALTSEAKASQDTAPFVDKQRLVLVRDALQTLRGDLAAFAALLKGPLDDLANRRDEILEDADDYVSQVATLLARAATFNVPQSGWRFAYDFQRTTYLALLAEATAVAERWQGRIAEFQGRIDEHDALDGAVSVDEHYRVLGLAERAIATTPMSPLPATFALYRKALVDVSLVAFTAKRQQFVDLPSSASPGVTALRTELLGLLPISDFDETPFSLTAAEDAMVRFAEDALKVVTTVMGGIDQRLARALASFTAHDDAALAVDQVQALEQAAVALMGEGFRIVPEFTLAPARGDEVANAIALSNSGTPFTHLTAPADPAQALDFPVDTWLHGVARVRDKMHDWEQVLLNAMALGVAEPRLDALQFPYAAGDTWVGLSLADGQKLDKDRLLYTAHFAAAFNKTAPQCGLMLDEWTETIPGETADTGIALHYDRPSTEAPQAWLLVTPSDFRGQWQWADLVDGIVETFELAKRRTIEPKHVDALPYAPFLPATVMASQARQLTIAANLAFNNRVLLRSQDT
jgi:hypothetical protein